MVEETDAPILAVMGDSTIDNVIWMHKNKKECVIERLRTIFGADRVHNLAADGFRTVDVLEGCKPHISYYKRQEIGDPFPGTSG